MKYPAVNGLLDCCGSQYSVALTSSPIETTKEWLLVIIVLLY